MIKCTPGRIDSGNEYERVLLHLRVDLLGGIEDLVLPTTTWNAGPMVLQQRAAVVLGAGKVLEQVIDVQHLHRQARPVEEEPEVLVRGVGVEELEDASNGGAGG